MDFNRGAISTLENPFIIFIQKISQARMQKTDLKFTSRSIVLSFDSSAFVAKASDFMKHFNLPA